MSGLNIPELPGASGFGSLSGMLLSKWLFVGVMDKAWMSRLSVHMYAQEFFMV